MLRFTEKNPATDVDARVLEYDEFVSSDLTVDPMTVTIDVPAKAVGSSPDDYTTEQRVVNFPQADWTGEAIS